MAKSATHDSNNQQYAPSWIDRFTAWIGRLPGPCWSYFLGLWLALLLVQTIVSWVEGSFPVGTLNPVQVFMSGVIAFFLALFYYLDERAGAALAILRPALTASESKYQDLHFRLTTLPSRPAILASLVMLATALLAELINEPYFPEALASFPTSANLFRIIYLIAWCLFGAFMYHTIRQLRLINHIYTRYTRINLFQMKPLYAFSNLSAITAGSLAIIIYGFLIVNPNMDTSDPAILIWVFVFLITAFVTFIWPQLGIHRLQIAEKDRLLEEANQHFEATIVELHQRVDDGKLEGMMDLNMAIASLQMELKILNEIPTWPWVPETVRWLATALLLPLGLWLIQVFLQGMLSP